MEDTALISKIQTLKNIKPNRAWAVLARQRIVEEAFGREERAFPVFRFWERPALVFSLLSVIVGGGIIAEVSKTSLPGDALYVLKAKAEQARLSFYSDATKSFAQLAIAQKRLDELKEVAVSKNTENLSSALKEFDSNVENASRRLAELILKDPSKTQEVGKELALLIRQKNEVEKILGSRIGQDESELDILTKALVENEIATLNKATLTETQSVMFERAKDEYANGRYQESFELIWTLSSHPK